MPTGLAEEKKYRSYAVTRSRRLGAMEVSWIFVTVLICGVCLPATQGGCLFTSLSPDPRLGSHLLIRLGITLI